MMNINLYPQSCPADLGTFTCSPTSGIGPLRSPNVLKILTTVNHGNNANFKNSGDAQLSVQGPGGRVVNGGFIPAGCNINQCDRQKLIWDGVTPVAPGTYTFTVTYVPGVDPKTNESTTTRTNILPLNLAFFFGLSNEPGTENIGTTCPVARETRRVAIYPRSKAPRVRLWWWIWARPRVWIKSAVITRHRSREGFCLKL